MGPWPLALVLVLAGGLFAGGAAQAAGGVTWTEAFPAVRPASREGAGLVYDAGSGQMVLYGGCPDAAGGYFADTWTGDGSVWSEWTGASPASPGPRCFAAMTYDARKGEVVLFGGWKGAAGGYTAETWTGDGSTWRDWTAKHPTSPLPSARMGAIMVYDARAGGGGPLRGGGRRRPTR